MTLVLNGVNIAAFYSYVTMNINAEPENTGKLTVDSGFEGLDSELHLALNGGNIGDFGGERPERMPPEGDTPPDMPEGMEPPQF